MNRRLRGSIIGPAIRCSSFCDMPPVNTRTLLRSPDIRATTPRINLPRWNQEPSARGRLLGMPRRLKSISVRAALARLEFANHHQSTCSFVGFDMSDVRHLLEGRRVGVVKAACSMSADLPEALDQLVSQNRRAFEAAASAVVIMSSGAGRILLADIGATWRVLRANPPGLGKAVYATCTHPSFGNGYELLVLLGFSKKHAGRGRNVAA